MPTFYADRNAHDKANLSCVFAASGKHPSNAQKCSITRVMTSIHFVYLAEFLKPLSLYGAKVYEESWLLPDTDAPEISLSRGPGAGRNRHVDPAD